MGRYITIIEVSQKQAYIFGDNKLKENIRRSGNIADITAPGYIRESVSAISGRGDLFSDRNNLVYSGGGHTILEFPSETDARLAVQCYTRRVMEEYPDIELFAKTIPYDEKKTPGENVKELTAALERKKSERRSVFHQGTFGIERLDVNTARPILVGLTEEKEDAGRQEADPDEHFVYTVSFEELGGTKDDKNFIAVVHIDGNAMGKRVEEASKLFACGQWEEYKSYMRQFSEGIAEDFRGAYQETEKIVAEAILAGKLKELSLTERNGKYVLPMWRVISEGDDICFVSEGRIGIECAVIFIRQIAAKINRMDQKPYAACAGVAIVHRKYPFYRAYELAEELCSNAKRFGVNLAGHEEGPTLSSIDWHIEYGEVQDSLEETRKQYLIREGGWLAGRQKEKSVESDNKKPSHLELRPYLITGPMKLLEKEKIRRYENFRMLSRELSKDEEAYGRSMLKGLREILKNGEEAAAYYLKFHKVEELGRDAYYGVYADLDFSEILPGSGETLQRKIFETTADGTKRCLLFDAIEAMDVFLPVEDTSRA